MSTLKQSFQIKKKNSIYLTSISLVLPQNNKISDLRVLKYIVSFVKYLIPKYSAE